MTPTPNSCFNNFRFPLFNSKGNLIIMQLRQIALIVVSHHLQASGKSCQQGSSDLHQTLPKIPSALYNVETETLQDINLWIKTSCQRYYTVFICRTSHHWKLLVCQQCPPHQPDLQPYQLLSIIPSIYHCNSLKLVDPILPRLLS